jgi:hypothetical protein
MTAHAICETKLNEVLIFKISPLHIISFPPSYNSKPIINGKEIFSATFRRKYYRTVVLATLTSASMSSPILLPIASITA